jgi:uncharacterized protein (TIGR00369 family)
MAIWFHELDLVAVNERGRHSMVEHLDIEFIDFGDDYLVARMPVDQRTHQPLGIMHGGASCVLAETIGSTAANYCVDYAKQFCVGLDINTNHIKSIRSGFVIGTAKPFHLGRTTQVWGIEIRDEQQNLISINRLTMAVLDRNQQKK